MRIHLFGRDEPGRSDLRREQFRRTIPYPASYQLPTRGRSCRQGTERCRDAHEKSRVPGRACAARAIQ
jgi:hypothetical protein